MKYVNAKDILPENILKQLQTYAAGTLLYVPKEGEEKSWGEFQVIGHIFSSATK